MTREEDLSEVLQAGKGMVEGDSRCFRIISFFELIASFSLVLMLTGCGATRSSKYYQLTVPAAQNGVQTGDPVGATLVVSPLLASHLYREDRIVYSTGEEQMGTYEYHRWVEPPTEMIQEVLLRELRASGRYKAVYGERSSVNGDFLIRGRLYEFKEVSGRPLLAKVTFELEMRELKSGSTVWRHYYSHEEPVSGKDVPAVVAALDRNVQTAVKEMLASLDQYFAEHPFK